MWGKPQVFLSYAREDEIPVRKLYRKLQEEGLRPWMDVEDIPPGNDWQTEIEEALDKSAVFLAILTPRSAEKPGMLQKEITLAKERRAQKGSSLRVIPLRLEPCMVPNVLRDLQWVDLFDPDGWTGLMREIRPPRRWRLALIAAAALAVVPAIWVYERPCSFVSARASGGCTSQPNMVGVTFWRLRKSVVADPPGIRSIIQPPPEPGGASGAVEFTPVRLDPSGYLDFGDLFYVSIESTREGYLYVVDRELHSNGSTGPPVLIFPTTRAQAGDNHLEKSALIRIPSVDATPSYFQIAGGGAPDYQGELFTVILLQKPIAGLEVPTDRLALDSAQFETWQKEWLRPAAYVRGTSGSLQEQTGGVITESEARALRSPGGVLQTPDDPLPAIIYRVTPGAEDGRWVDFRLPVKR